MSTTVVDVRPLAAERADDFLRFFDGPAFADNPKWASCYCQCFYEDHRLVHWPSRTATQNRALACERIASGAMRGYLAYEGDVPVGWCNAAPRPLLHVLDEEPVADAAEVGTILCFVVDPLRRGQGIARRLLDAACDGLREQGMAVVEANPRVGTDSPTANHFGPLGMYLSAGFVVHREDDDGSVWVRRPLSRPA